MEKPSGADLVDIYIAQIDTSLQRWKKLEITEDDLIQNINNIVQAILKAETNGEINSTDRTFGIKVIQEHLKEKGIEEEKINNIFQKYTQSSSPAKFSENALYSNLEPLLLKDPKELEAPTTATSAGIAGMVPRSFDWRKISHLNRNLFLLEKEVQSNNKENAEKIFKEIASELTDFSSIDIDTLKRLNSVLISYSSILSRDGKRKSLFSKRSPHLKEVDGIKESVSKILKKYQSFRDQLIEQNLHNLKKLDGEALKDALRVFIMDMCQGKCIFNGERTPPCSINRLFATIFSIKGLGKKIQDLLTDPNLFSSYEWKTGACALTPPPNISECITSKNSKRTMQVSKELVDDTISKIEAERDFRLRNLEMVYTKVKDDPNQAVAGKQFEKTSAWYIGSFMGRNNQHSFECAMQKIGETHGIVCITDSRDESLRACSNILTLDHKGQAPFPQDFVDFSINEIRIPIMNIKSRYPELNDTFLSNFFSAKRQVRNKAWKPTFNRQGQEINPRVAEGRTIGEPLLRDYGKTSIALALGLGATPIMNLTYNEGGNTLIGSKDGKKFAIIGQDSYDISKYFMEKDLGIELTEEQVKMAFAIDYGIKKENIFFVEQPGDFHLDMNVAIVGENMIAVNNAEKAYEDFDQEQEKFLNQFLQNQKKEVFENLKKNAKEQILRRAKGKKVFEDITAKNIQDHGFQVIRVSGRFDYQVPQEARPRPVMNFFNMITAITIKGKKIVIFMGVIDEKFSKKFEAMIQFKDIENFYFLNLQESQFCLGLHGGISCRTKVIPNV